MSWHRSFLLSLLSLSPFIELASEENSEECSLTSYPYRVSARHIEARGIGYNKGYTTIDLLATIPSLLTTDWVPLLDGRFHVFNNGKFAANAGLGIRYISDKYVYGLNAFYDYRNTSHHSYNQFSLGVEALSSFWDFRLNGYLPLGSTKSGFYDAQYSRFSGNYLLVSQRQEFAMRGLNAEAGMHIAKMDHISLYGAFGPYYFGRKGRNAVGGRGRFSATFLDHLKLELSGSYDPVFHGIAQGEISLIVPFGSRKTMKTKRERTCSEALWLRERAIQTIDRSEIIVVTHKNTETAAIHPITGAPHRFLFVNNLSHSNGTYESPYNTLADAEATLAPYDTLYVFPGDGTTTGMDSGIVLQDNVRLLGSALPFGLDTAQGKIFVPAQSFTLPKITKGLSGSPSQYSSVIQLGHNCEVAGIHITSADTTGFLFAGILGGVADPTSSSSIPGIQNAFIHDNQIEGNYTFAAIRLYNSYGSFAIENNTISSISSNLSQKGMGISIYTATPLKNSIDYSLSNNTISNTKWHGIYFGPQGSSVKLNASNNTINTAQGSGIVFLVQADTFTSVITGNTLSNITGLGIGTTATSVKVLDSTISNNFISNAGAVGFNSIHFQPTVTNRVCSKISNNTVLNAQNGPGIFCQPNTPAGCVSITNNLLDRTQGIGITSSGSSFSTDIIANAVKETITSSSSMTLQTASGGSMCAKILGNVVDLPINAGSGVSVEAGSQAVSGTPQAVSKGSCPCGCSD